MSFNCPFKTDNKAAADAVAEYYETNGYTYEAKYAREYSDVGDLSGSTWRSFVDDVINVCNGERLPLKEDADAWTSPDYRISAERLKTCADIASLMLNGCCGKYFRKAIDEYEGNWMVAPQYTDYFGMCSIRNGELLNENIASNIDAALNPEFPNYEVLFDDDDSDAANSVAWMKLAEYIASDNNIGIPNSAAVEREEAIAFAARCMSALYAFEVDSIDGVLVPPMLVNRMRDELREFAGADYDTYIDDFIDFSTYNGWVITQMSDLSEPLAIAIDKGVTELVAMPG